MIKLVLWFFCGWGGLPTEVMYKTLLWWGPGCKENTPFLPSKVYVYIQNKRDNFLQTAAGQFLPFFFYITEKQNSKLSL
jgi:hypothetical protein